MMTLRLGWDGEFSWFEFPQDGAASRGLTQTAAQLNEAFSTKYIMAALKD